MGIKSFLKPTRSKIVITVILYVLAWVLVLINDVYCTPTCILIVGEPCIPPAFCLLVVIPFSILMPLIYVFHQFFVVGPLYNLVETIVANIVYPIYYYILACLILYLKSRFYKKPYKNIIK
jgi:hypothetical protein